MVHTPLDVAEIETSPAFGSDDADLVRASLYLRQAAWCATPVGGLPCDVPTLARLARLTPEKLQSAWKTLFAGWELRDDGRLWHGPTSAMGRALERRAQQLQALEAVRVMLVHDAIDSGCAGAADAREAHSEACGAAADLFGLAPSTPAPSGAQALGAQAAAVRASPTKGKRIYPSDFAPNEASCQAMLRAGYRHPDEQAWLLEKFADFGRAQRRMYADWQAAFRNYLSSSITARDFQAVFGYRLGQRPETGTGLVLADAMSAASPLERLRARAQQGSALRPTFAQQQLNNARVLLGAAMARRAGAAREVAEAEVEAREGVRAQAPL